MDSTTLFDLMQFPLGPCQTKSFSTTQRLPTYPNYFGVCMLYYSVSTLRSGSSKATFLASSSMSQSAGSLPLPQNETWKSFQNKCPAKTHPQDLLAKHHINEELRIRTATKHPHKRHPDTSRRWRWLGNVGLMPSTSLPRTALRWTPQGRRNRGRPKETWRRAIERELKSNWDRLSLETAPRTTADKARWRSLVLPQSARRLRRGLTD